MPDLPHTFVLFDSEYTSWEGAQERKWSGENEHREIVQFGAIKVRNDTLAETDSFSRLVRPSINPILSDYFTNLTGIRQEQVDREGIDFRTAVTEFKAWCGELPVYSFGHDGEVVAENCTLEDIPCPFPESSFHNIREFFKGKGIPADDYYSSTIVTAFGEEPARRGHDAVNDARSILDGLVLLKKKLAPGQS